MTEPEDPNPEENLTRAEELLERLDEARSRLEAATDPDQAIEILSELSEIAKDVEPRSQRRSATPMRSPDEHRERIEDFLAGLELSEELGRLDEVVRYALAGGGKRIRPVLCLATTEAAGGDPDQALAAAAAIELVHSFSLVHDDLPALDDDELRRGRPTVHVRFGEAQAILAGDALLNEALPWRSATRSRTWAASSRLRPRG